jgi:hypothetical protein
MRQNKTMYHIRIQRETILKWLGSIKTKEFPIMMTYGKIREKIMGKTKKNIFSGFVS